LARNSGGTADLFNSAIRVGVAGFGTAIQQGDAANLSTNIKSLWETCTGLTLP
jgi:F0F1-type ATP synthase membrane subunit c/vacuolar-type H+-ATPase subunit K